MNVPTFHKGDDWPITLLLNEADANGVLVPYVSTGATFQVAIVNLDRTTLLIPAVTGTATANGVSCVFAKETTGTIPVGLCRVEVQSLKGGLKTSWSDSQINVVPGLII